MKDFIEKLKMNLDELVDDGSIKGPEDMASHFTFEEISYLAEYAIQKFNEVKGAKV